jgi:hypothetical protein
VYLPERTLDIAKLCVESVLPEFKQGTLESVAAWRTVSHSLPPLLKPIATWHPDFAESALDLLWKLEAEEPGANWQSDSNAIVAIAEVAAFSVRKPYRASEMVMKWLEKKVSTQAFIERLYEQPWILGALLKPFFGRTIENTWSTGRTVHIETKYVSAEKTRPLRQRALAIAEKLLNGSDSMLNHSVIPIIEKAIGPVWRKTGETTARDHEAWQPDRLHAVRLIETAGTLHANDPALLLRLRRILNGRCEHDPDAVIKNECVRVRAGLPDTFELRVMRAIGSWAHEEIIIRSEPEVTFRARWDEAEKEWHNFQREVAEEVCDRFGSAEQLCNFISKQLEQLTALKMTTLAGQVLEHVANKSPYWCSELLKQILYGDLTPLDGYVWPVINCARTVSPQEYDRAIKWLHTNGRPDQLFGVLRYFGWKFLHGGGLDQQERDCIMSIARRAEPAIVRAVANTSQIFFIEDPEWVLELLTQLKISDEPTGAAGLEALAHVVEKHSARLRAEDVSECLKKFGAFCLPETTSDEGNLDKVAQRFAKEVYEHVKNICERAETDPNVLHRGYFEPIDLGLIADDSYVDAEINQLWERSLGKEAFGQKFRLDLIRSMVWSDPARAVSRLTGLLRRAKNSEQLKWVVRIGAGEGSRFVFEYPDLVRVMLTMSVDFDAAEQIRTALLFSAQGVERSYTNHELDPEYRYILEQSEALANRFSGDATLHSFYEAIIGAENAERRWRKQVFSDQVD